MRAMSASVVTRENVCTVPWFLSKRFKNKIQENPYSGSAIKQADWKKF
jgi:hypothetical protein